MGAYRELLTQAKKGNHPAIEKLYERYYTLLRSYSFVMAVSMRTCFKYRSLNF